jgi:hypothetical protein
MQGLHPPIDAHVRQGNRGAMNEVSRRPRVEGEEAPLSHVVESVEEHVRELVRERLILQVE